MNTVEKKSAIVAIIAAATRSNLQSAFSQSLTPILEQVIGVKAEELTEFTAIMDNAMPKIGAAMSELFNEEFMSELVAPTLEQYSEADLDQVYELVTNPMYTRFMGDMTIGMVQSPAYMQGVMEIGPKVEEILQSVWEELNPPKNPEQEMQAAADRLFEAMPEQK
jgi:hypothetical protein